MPSGLVANRFISPVPRAPLAFTLVSPVPDQAPGALLPETVVDDAGTCNPAGFELSRDGATWSPSITLVEGDKPSVGLYVRGEAVPPLNQGNVLRLVKSVTVPVSTLWVGLMAYWKLEEASGARAAAFGGVGLDSVGTDPSGVAGKSGDCASFVTGGNLRHGYNAALHPGKAGEGASWSVWFNRSANPPAIVGIAGEDTGSNPAWGLRISTAGALSCFARDSAGSIVNFLAGSVCDGTWKNFIMTYDATDRKLRGYLNGSLLATSGNTATTANLRNNEVGVTYGLALSTYYGSAGHTALLDEVAVFNRTLQLADAEEMWASGAGKFYA